MKDWRKLDCSEQNLRSLAIIGVHVFTCAHHWVDDKSIQKAVSLRVSVDITLPHHERTNRAWRIATMVQMLRGGVQFPRLLLRPIFVDGRLYSVRLSDGHHRLRAMQFAAKDSPIRFGVKGPRAQVEIFKAVLTKVIKVNPLTMSLTAWKA